MKSRIIFLVAIVSIFLVACSGGGFPDDAKQGLIRAWKGASGDTVSVDDVTIISAQRATTHPDYYDEMWCVIVDFNDPDAWASKYAVPLVRIGLEWRATWGPIDVGYHNGPIESRFLQSGCTNFEN